MSEKLINLSKQVDIVLSKRNIPQVVAQVGAAFDVSGSTRNMFENGTIQNLMDRLFALSYKFDDNQILDAWSFSSSADELEGITQDMFSNYVPKYILQNNSISKWGGTNYYPVMDMIVEHYAPMTTQVVKKAKTGFFNKLFGQTTTETIQGKGVVTGDPAYITFVTDGENSDQSQVLDLLYKTQGQKIFWQFIGIGAGVKFDFLKKLAKQYDNVGFFDAGDIDRVPDSTLYEALLSEKFINWYQN